MPLALLHLALPLTCRSPAAVLETRLAGRFAVLQSTAREQAVAELGESG